MNGLYRLEEDDKFKNENLKNFREERNQIAHFISADRVNFRINNFNINKYFNSDKKYENQSLVSAKLIIIKKFFIETKFPDMVIDSIGSSLLETLKDFLKRRFLLWKIKRWFLFVEV